MILLSDFLWKMSFFKGIKIPKIMIEYNHSKGNEIIPKKIQHDRKIQENV